MRFCRRLRNSLTILQKLKGIPKIDLCIHSSHLAHVMNAKICPTTFFLHFFNWYDSPWPPCKKSWCVSLAPENTFFIKIPPLEKKNVNKFKRGPLWKKVFSGAKQTHPDILRGGHRNPYKLENAIKSGGTVFCIYHLGYQGAVYRERKIEKLLSCGAR